MTAKDPQSIRVVIYDQEYFMRGDLNQEYIQKLAQYVDGKMRSIAGRTRTVDTLRVAILAALNLADEYHQLKARYENVTDHLDQKVGKYADALDAILSAEQESSVSAPESGQEPRRDEIT